MKNPTIVVSCATKPTLELLQYNILQNVSKNLKQYVLHVYHVQRDLVLLVGFHDDALHHFEEAFVGLYGADDPFLYVSKNCVYGLLGVIYVSSFAEEFSSIQRIISLAASPRLPTWQCD